MADNPVITSLDQLGQSERELLLEQLQNSSSRGRKGLEDTVTEMELRFKVSLSEQLKESLIKRTLEHPSAQPNQEMPFGEGGLDIAVGMAGGVLLAGPLRDSSNSNEIISAMHAQQIDFEKDTLFEKVQQALERRDDTTATSLLDTLQPKELLDSQVKQLQVRIRDAGGDETIRKLVEQKYEAVKKDREKREKEEHKNAESSGTFLLKQLAKEQDVAKRKKLFDDYFIHQQNATTSDLYTILSRRGFLGLGHRSILSRQVKSRLLQLGLQEKREREKAREQTDNAFVTTSHAYPHFRIFRIFQRYDRGLGGAAPFSINGGGVPLSRGGVPNIPRLHLPHLGNILKFGRLASFLGGSAITPYLLGVLGGLAVAVFIVIFVLLLLPASSVGISGSPVGIIGGPGGPGCLDQNPPNQAMVDILSQQFHIRVHTNDTISMLQKVSKEVNKNVYNVSSAVIFDIYKTTCILSGYKFIQLLHAERIPIDIYQIQQSCAEHVGSTGPSYTIVIGPCGGNSAGNQFLLTHEYGHIIQWENPSLFDQFCGTIFHGFITRGHCQSTNPNTIPTYNCLDDYKYLGIPGPYPEECFSDMVGAYLTYQQFTDILGNMPPGANRMSNYPQNFPDYYTFAKDNIFIPITTSSSTPTIFSSSDSCGGKYAQDLQRNTAPYQGINFGDPQCTFNKNDLFSLLKTLDSANASFWFTYVVPCESTYDPNAEQINDPVDPAHAWGLFQMGRGKNGPLDHGDVIWNTQASNAVSYQKAHGWNYWECAIRHGR